MSNQTLATSMVMIGRFKLCITTRSAGDSLQTMEELTFRTIGAWLHLVDKLEKAQYELSEAEQGSVESRYTDFMRQTDPEFNLAEAWGDARVTIWNKEQTPDEIKFNLNSDDSFQTAMNVYVAHNNAIQRMAKRFGQSEKAQPAPSNEKPATPKGNSSNGQSASRFLTRKQMLEQLHEGDTAPMKIAKIMLRSQDDTRYYELYPMLGNGSVGKYAELRVYTDNEVALNNGVLQVLNDIGLKTGKGMESTWIVECKLAKNKKGELDTYPQSIQETT